MASPHDIPAFGLMLTICAGGGRCIGFVLARGPTGFEAVDPNGAKIGLFETVRSAIAAICGGAP